MWHKRALQIVFSVLTLWMVSGAVALAQLPFRDSDWLMHRGAPSRQGSNEDPGLNPGQQLSRTWVWPPTRDLPAEIVVDNTALPPPGPTPTGQNFQAFGSWVRPTSDQRASGAWPPSDSDPEKVGDYVYTTAIQSQTLANIGIPTLRSLPNVTPDIYRTVHNELLPVTLDRVVWTFGGQYPAGTFQGRRDVSGQPLAANQRYAIYINIPNSGTLGTSGPRPNADHYMVRVSWGADVNDPIRSRIFMIEAGGTGGFWKRIRTDKDDDRFFPYDGTNPIRVTLYGITPDAVGDRNLFLEAPIIAADAVRLVPEALRGDIRAPAASAVFPSGSQITDPGAVQLTFFARDETTGPRNLFPTLGNPGPLVGGFATMPLNPTLPVQPTVSGANYNPLVADPTRSVRNAVFYCIEDDFNNGRFSRLRWRRVAATPLQTTTVDDLAGTPAFTFTPPAGMTPGFTQIVAPQSTQEQAFGSTYYASPAQGTTPPPVNPGDPEPPYARWEQPLSASLTYSIYVWIPGGQDGQPEYARNAIYRILTDRGPLDVVLDQRNTDNAIPGRPRVGTWRLLTGGIRFGAGVYNGNNVPALGQVTLYNYSVQDSANGRIVAADALQFVPESQLPSSVVAAPLIANVQWPSGTTRPVVYFATTEGRLWALDALGAGPDSTQTTVYWTYPSLGNPATGVNGINVNVNPQDDPNFQPGTPSNQPLQGIDGDLERTQRPNPNPPPGAIDIWTVNAKVPDLGGFYSSPIYVEVPRGSVREKYIVIGARNGRIYAFDAVGRFDPATNDPYAATQAAGDNPGIPGTTFRVMTWPTLGRDKWLRAGGINGGAGAYNPARYPDDPAKGFFDASLASPKLDANFRTDQVIAGAGDGHVYAIDLQSLDPRVRVSNPSNAGRPLWQYPGPNQQLDPIVQPGVLTPTGKYIFTAGRRVYAISSSGSGPNNVATLQWTYPYTSSPPGNPNPGDQPREETPFTAPAYRQSVSGFNGDNEVVFIANQDGRVLAIDASPNSNPVGGPSVLWESRTFGATRASAVFLNSLTPQPNFLSAAGPAIMLPLDTGGIIGLSVRTGGRLFWGYVDAIVGGVPLLDADGNLTTFSTSNAFRGADATTANGWVYNGDEGNPDTGERNGQMRAYAIDTIGMITPDEPDVQPAGQGNVDLRLVELWESRRDNPTNGPYDGFGSNDPMLQRSPWTEWNANNTKPNSQGGFTIYEYGDTIYVAAWGVYTGPVLPQVTFRLTGAGTNRPPVTVGAVRDLAYAGPPLTLNGNPATPWVAKYAFPLGRGSEADPQTPGRRYTVFAQAQIQTPGGASFPTFQLAAGQASVVLGNPNPAPGQDPNDLPNNNRRNIAVAHPFSLTTRSIPAGTPVGANFRNIIGWTTGGNDYTEVLANGNRVVNIAANSITVAGEKNLVAPVGLVNHGGSSAYLGVDNNGNRVPALFIADRSSLYKLGQSLNNVRVERRELRWGWNPNEPNPLYTATGGVMNPLPWEDFPNRLPNDSLDYPNIDRTASIFRGGGVDMSTRGIPLPRPTVDTNTGVKTLNPLPLDLLVTAPRFQPANVNRIYFDISGGVNVGLPNGLMAPMAVTVGTDPVTGGIPGISGLISPSAGYVGSYVVYIDSNGDGRFAGNAPQVEAQQAQVSRDEVYRQLDVGVAIPPDVRLRTEEETIDMGSLPHSTGYSPNIPFTPSFLGPYNGNSPLNAFLSPWDTPGQTRFFAPFTVKNEGNVNLVNLRVAKMIGAPGSSISDPSFWGSMISDQVETLTGVGQIWTVPFNLIGLPAVGNLGMVTSLDHGRTVASGSNVFDIEINYNARFGTENFWPLGLPAALFPSGNPYVQAGNPLVSQGWAPGINPRPTLHKARPGDAAPTVLSIPDVAYGDPLGVLGTLTTGGNGVPGREVRPKIGIAIPLGTPAGTYTTPIYLFEDFTPTAWRQWLAAYQQLTGNPVSPVAAARDDDGVLNTVVNGGRASPVESVVSNPFRLKVTVREARLTNGTTPGTFPMIDVRGSLPAFGANLLPAAIRDRRTGHIALFWASNRLNDNRPPEPLWGSPWTLFFTRLNAVANNNGTVLDWRFEPGNTRWWMPLSASAQYPDASVASGLTPRLFPANQTEVAGNPNTPLVPGRLVTLPVNGSAEYYDVRHATPALAQDDLAPVNNLDTWLFWQGAVTKREGGSTTIDTRTFYVPLDRNTLAPDTTVNGGVPFSFLNDPALPKFAPKPLLMTDVNGRQRAYLFWYGGASGRSRIYYNLNGGDLTSVTDWSRDIPLPTSNVFISVSDPLPVRRLIPNASGQLIDAIDLFYTGVMRNRRVPEVFLTRYTLGGNGRLFVTTLPAVQNELMVRDGSSKVWMSRDIGWVFRNPGTRDFVDASGNPPYTLSLRRADGSVITPLTQGRPTFDNATGLLYFNSALGGRLIVDPQLGTVTFPDVAPRNSDALFVTYTPQAMRVNVTRNDSGALEIPAGWLTDAGFAARPHVPAAGSNYGAVAFIDRSANPRTPYILGLPQNGIVPVTRMWTFYRKTGTGVTSAATIYYKTMRLMVRLPRGVLRDLNPQTGQYSLGSNIQIAGNRGPVEVDWVRGRLYFTELDEGNDNIRVVFNYARDAQGNVLTVPETRYRVAWGDEISVALQPGDQTTNETAMPLDAAVNEGQISAFKDPLTDRVWVFWSSTRAGTVDLYSTVLCPQFYPLTAAP